MWWERSGLYRTFREKARLQRTKLLKTWCNAGPLHDGREEKNIPNSFYFFIFVTLNDTCEDVLGTSKGEHDKHVVQVVLKRTNTAKKMN